ncbi:MAG: linear amide C-N hydrolase [Synergistaceae bacterium]|nr:linear amide C-N hydrolase [Synergistaceae bacterium]MBQ9629769.1 linear amide C-N hydrolase [Synergistaceae bacterium]
MIQHKSKSQSRVRVMMSALLLVFVLSVSAYAAPFTAPKKLADYLYYMEYTDYNVDLTTGEKVKTGFACSAVRNGNFYGRNLDLDYCDVPEFVIKVAAKESEGRYASIGMAAILTLKSGQVDKVSEAELLAMPNLTFDGINENGVAMNCNVAPAVDLDFATPLSTNFGKPRIHAVSVVRYVLDHAKSAAHGVELLKNMDIYGGYGTWGLHWMLSDEKETYIIECIDGELVVRNDTDNIMTNFYVNYGSYSKYSKYTAQKGQKVAGKVYEDFPILTPHACGVERYAILKEHYAEGAESAEGMAHLMERVKYTQAYEADTNPFWYTEYTEGNLTIANNPMDFKAMMQFGFDTYKQHDRNVNPNNFWQTWHTSVYDLANRTLRLNIQEDYSTHYDFKLN